LAQSGSFVVNAFNDVRAFGRQGISALAISAVEEALWDLRGKQFGVNVTDILGACRTAVPSYVNAMWLSSTIDELHKEAEGLLTHGFRAIKMHVGLPDPDKDVERVRAVRETLGPDVALLVDAAQLFPQMSLALMACVPNASYHEYLSWFGALFQEPVMRDESGASIVPGRPGWGFAIDPSVLVD
jgi:L-alanine-DL-glutamate epimerase-like enolase superfamily enzyme